MLLLLQNNMDNPYAPLLSFLAFGTLLFQIGIVLGIILFGLSFISKPKSFISKLSKIIGDNAMAAGLLIAAISTVSSLFLSEVALFPPCKLCWYQRIFMYPQVVVLGVGLLYNDTKAKIMALALSIIGALIAIYHILVQFFPASFKCSDEVANCALKSFTYYGFITIPVMSLTAFMAIILVLLFSLKKSR